MTTDPIAEMLNSIKNGQSAGKVEVKIHYSQLKEQIARILKNQSLITDYQVAKTQKPTLTIRLDPEQPAQLHHFVRISRPSLRIYRSNRLLPRPTSPLGTIIVSTSQGVMTGLQAKKRGLGGEIICEVS